MRYAIPCIVIVLLLGASTRHAHTSLPAASQESPLFSAIATIASAKNALGAPEAVGLEQALAAAHKEHRSKGAHYRLSEGESEATQEVPSDPTCTVACTYICTVDCTQACTDPCTELCTYWCTFWCTNEETCSDTICVFTTPGGIFAPSERAENVFGTQQPSTTGTGPVIVDCGAPCTKPCTYVCTGSCSYTCTHFSTYSCTASCTFSCTAECTYQCTTFCTTPPGGGD